MAQGHVLLTGATGFIGSYILEELLASGYKVTAAIRHESDTSVLQQKGVDMVELDYKSESQMRHSLAAIAPIEYVVHAAGITKSADQRRFREVNAEQSRRLLQSLPSPPRCFLLLSSMGSYGPNHTKVPLQSSMPQRPNNAYGRSKYLAEQYTEKSGLPYTILCPTGVYGFGEEDYRLSIQAMEKGWSFVTGGAPQQLSFVYVRDVARAVLFLLQEPRALGQRFLLSDGKSYLDSDFTHITAELLQRRVREIRIPLPIIRLACYCRDLLGKLTKKPRTLNSDKYQIIAQRNWLCDISPLARLGFTPLYDLHSGLKEAFQLAAESAVSPSEKEERPTQLKRTDL